MKKWILLLLALILLLPGCTGDPAETSVPTAITLPEETQPEIRILDGAEPWDSEGVLLEIPLNIPDALHYSNAGDFDGSLLLWNLDDHIQDVYTLELCVVDLQTGLVTGQRDLRLSTYTTPQILGESLYICDTNAGEILLLNKALETVRTWNTESYEGSWYMGGNETLYVCTWNMDGYSVNLKTGEKTALLEEGNAVSNMYVSGQYAIVEYYRADTGALDCVALDLRTGETAELPGEMDGLSADYRDGYWLCEEYLEGCCYFLCSPEKDILFLEAEDESLELLGNDRLLRRFDEGCSLSLYDLSGKMISQCRLSDIPYNLFCDTVIPSEHFGGYFLLVSDYASSQRLLYWNTEAFSGEEDLPFEKLPEPSQEQQALRQRARELEEKYGVSICVGSDTPTEYFDFYAEQATDYTTVLSGLKTLEQAMDTYPEGFFRQLRYGSVYGLQIHLVGALESNNPEEYTHSYAAFTQYDYDCNVIALDVYQITDQLVFHELSHVIDSFLEYDAAGREDALFSEEAWDALNPGWFPGYTYTYSMERELWDYSSFIDSYATISPTEDRARIMEYAMVSWGEYNFEEGSVLKNKLRYYCRCIRDAFDTEHWPETLPWEQFL